MISREEAKHIADLARIDLSDNERTTIGEDLSVVVEYVKKLSEADTTNTASLNGGTDVVNALRDDVQTKEQKELCSPETVAALINAAPAKEKGYVKVKSVF